MVEPAGLDYAADNPAGHVTPPAPRDPPFAAGQRVRCVVSTARDPRGVELLGRVGTVERCAKFGPPGIPAGTSGSPGWCGMTWCPACWSTTPPLSWRRSTPEPRPPHARALAWRPPPRDTDASGP
jgi:hypothetical protein